MKKPAVFTVDLDSCLCDTRIRQAGLPPKEERADYDWEAYSLLCESDTPHEGVVRLVELLAQQMAFVVVSARIEKARSLTEAWLKTHLKVDPYLVVLNDLPKRFPHDEYKASQIQRLIQEGLDVRLHIDDWPPVEESLKKLNVPCLVVTPPQDKEIKEIAVNRPV